MIKIIILLSIFFSPIAQANIASVYGIGPTSTSMGGTSMVHGEPNPYAAFSNPAHLGFIGKVTASAGIVSIDPHLKPFGRVVLNSGGREGEFSSAGVLPGSGNILGLALPIGKAERPFTIGAAFYLPYASLVRVSGSPVNYPFYPMYNDINRNAFFVVGMGFQIFPAVSLGINFRSSVQSIASYELRSESSISYSANAVEARSKNKVGFSLLFDFEKLAGRASSLAFIYKAKSQLETKLTADISAYVPVNGELVSFPAFSPAEWASSFSRRFSGGDILSLDLAWVRWSEYRFPYGVGNINSYIIGQGMSDPGFKDVFVPRFGYQGLIKEKGMGFISRLVYRFGYAFHPTPVPEQNLDTNFVDSNRHLISFGMGVSLPKPWDDFGLVDLDVFGQWNYLEKKGIVKLASNNIGAPSYPAGGNIFVYGISAGLSF